MAIGFLIVAVLFLLAFIPACIVHARLQREHDEIMSIEREAELRRATNRLKIQ